MDILATAWLLVQGYVEVGEAKEVLRCVLFPFMLALRYGTVRCVALRRVTLPTEWKMGFIGRNRAIAIALTGLLYLTPFQFVTMRRTDLCRLACNLAYTDPKHGCGM